MVRPIEFVSVRGRVYTPSTVRAVILARLRRRWGSLLADDFAARVDQRLQDEAWCRSRNGMVPGALVRDLELECLRTAAGVKP